MWDRDFQPTQASLQTYNLLNLLIKVYNLFVTMPPLSLEELFGQAANDAAPEGVPQEEWEELPSELLEESKRNGGLGGYNQAALERQLEDFDPLGELLDEQRGDGEEQKRDLAQQKLDWIMSYKMKAALEKQKEHQELIERDLMPNIKQIMEMQAVVTKAATEQNLKQMDEFQKADKDIRIQIREVVANNQKIREQMPQVDSLTAALKPQVDALKSCEVTADMLMKEVLQPADPVSGAIIKYQVKLEAH